MIYQLLIFTVKALNVPPCQLFKHSWRKNTHNRMWSLLKIAGSLHPYSSVSCIHYTPKLSVFTLTNGR